MMTLSNTVYATGEGTPLVLVHAFPVDHRMWDDCAEQIARQARETGFTVLRPGLRAGPWQGALRQAALPCRAGQPGQRAWPPLR